MSGFFVRCSTVSLIISPTVADIATVFDTLRIVVRPVDQATKVIPFIHAADQHAITHSHRHSFGQAEIVCNQQRCPVADIDDEALVAGTVVIIRQQARHEAC